MKTANRFFIVIFFLFLMGTAMAACAPIIDNTNGSENTGDPLEPQDPQDPEDPQDPKEPEDPINPNPPGEGAPGTGVNIVKNALTLTIGAKGKLEYSIASDVTDKSVTWTTSNPSIITVDKYGIITAKGISTGGGTAFISGAATGTAVLTVKSNSDSTKNDTITITTTTAGLEDIMTLPPLKDQFKDYFMIGNIFNPGDVPASTVNNSNLTRHFNVLTHENNMKPYALTSGRDSTTGEITYTFDTADNMINAAITSGFFVHGHTLLWHSQNAGWMNNKTDGTGMGADKETVLAVMKKYVTDVAAHFKGRLHSWDVLNEVFPDGVSASAGWKTSMRDNNPWYKAIGSDFVYEGFLAARLADPDAILYYNDYNTDQTGKATMIRNMVHDVNQEYKNNLAAIKAENPDVNLNRTELLIEGIGMQEHHNTDVLVTNIKNTLNLFKPLGVIIAVSELDVLGQGYNAFENAGGQGTNKHNQSTVTNNGIINQAAKYNEYMKLYIEFKDIIERVSLWGVTDNNSWRSISLPLLFDHNGKAKPSYYSFISALPPPQE